MKNRVLDCLSQACCWLLHLSASCRGGARSERASEVVPAWWLPSHLKVVVVVVSRRVGMMGVLLPSSFFLLPPDDDGCFITLAVV